jgi:hypothetical protein
MPYQVSPPSTMSCEHSATPLVPKSAPERATVMSVVDYSTPSAIVR